VPKDNVTPLPKIPKEPHKWKCDERGCNAKGKAATKDDAKLALELHKAFVH